MSVTWEAFFVDGARLRGVYGSGDEALIRAVEATDHFRFLARLGAEELARNLEYAKKVAPRAYEPLQRVDLDPAAALRDIVLGRELRPMNVEFYDSMLWCICHVIGTSVAIDDVSVIETLEDVCGIRAEEHAVHPYLPVPAVRRALVTEFSVYSPVACKKLLHALERGGDEIEDVVDIDEWIEVLGERDPGAHMLVFGA